METIKLKLMFGVVIFLIMLYPTNSLDSAVKHTGVKILHDAGISGQNNTVCLLDNGIYSEHQYLGGCVGSDCKILATYNANTTLNDVSVMDHGTMTAGVIISSHNRYKGIAYGAKLVFIQVPYVNNISSAIIILVVL